MSLFGIAGASASDVGTAQTQYDNDYTVKKITKVDAKQLKIVKKSIKKHKKTFKRLKKVKKIKRSKKLTAQKRNKVRYSKFYAAAGSYKKVRRSTSANTAGINTLARSLTKGTGSQYNRGTKVFNWVKHHVRYKFYYNTKYGANGTLKYRKGNCVDQAHLVVALARSSGLQAKYAHAKVRFSSGRTYGHVWALVNVNGKWYNADTTSRRNSFGHMSGKVVRFKGIHNNLPL